MQPNISAAQEALGCALIDARAAEKVLELQLDDFEGVDREVFSAMKSLQAAGKPITLVTLNEVAAKHIDYIIEISTMTVTTAFIDHHITAIKERAKRRRIRAAATELYNAASDNLKKIGRAHV